MSEGRYSATNQLMLMKNRRNTNKNIESRYEGPDSSMQQRSLSSRYEGPGSSRSRSSFSNSATRKSNRNSLNEEEIRQMEKMERARQNMLKKIQQQQTHEGL